MRLILHNVYILHLFATLQHNTLNWPKHTRPQTSWLTSNCRCFWQLSKASFRALANIHTHTFRTANDKHNKPITCYSVHIIMLCCKLIGSVASNASMVTTMNLFQVALKSTTNATSKFNFTCVWNSLVSSYKFIILANCSPLTRYPSLATTRGQNKNDTQSVMCSGWWLWCLF